MSTDYLRCQRARAWVSYLAAKAARWEAQKNGDMVSFYKWDLEAAREKAAYDRAGEHLSYIERPHSQLANLETKRKI